MYWRQCTSTAFLFSKKYLVTGCRLLIWTSLIFRVLEDLPGQQILDSTYGNAIKDTLAFLHDHTTWECTACGYKLPFLLWNIVLDDDKATFWWDNKKNFQRWCLICISCKKLHSFDFHFKYHLYVTFVFKGRRSFKNSQYGSWPLNVSTNCCTHTRKFY